MTRTSEKSSRVKACELAATVMAGRPEDAPAPLIWSLCVFFENYIDLGASATKKDLGPKKPRKLQAVK